MSANAHEYRAGGGGAAHDGFVTKPVDMGVLLARVRDLLQLSWVSEPELDGSPAAEADRDVGTAPALARGSRHHIDDLYQLGLIGHVRGIQAKLREIEAEDGGNGAAAAKLRALVDRFEMKRYMKAVEAMRANA